jgi:hypothetical protein
MSRQLVNPNAEIAEKSPVQFFVIPVNFDFMPGSTGSKEVLDILYGAGMS